MKKTTKALSLILAIVLVIGGVNFAPILNGTNTVHAISKKKLYFVNDKKINVYSEKSEDSEIVKTIKRFKLVNIVGSKDDDGWVKIKFNDGEYKGFVKIDQLKKATSADYCVITSRNLAKKIAKSYGWKLTDEKYTDEKYRNDAGYTNYYSEIKTSFDIDGYYVIVKCARIVLNPNKYTNIDVVYIIYIDGRPFELGEGNSSLKKSLKVTQKKLSS